MGRGRGYRGRERGKGVGERGAGVEGTGSGGRGGGDNINYLLKMITENKVFHFLLRNWMFLPASDVCQIPFLTFISLGLAISLSLSACISLSLPLSHMKREVGRYVSEKSNYNN